MPYLNTGTDSPITYLDSNAFEKLVCDLSEVLGPSSGLDSEDVDPIIIQKLMEKYVSNESEWGSFALGDGSRGYTRNLIDEGNGKSNLLILVWSPGKGSAIHDHANAHCLMKILKGNLQETLYAWPDKERVGQGEVSPLLVTKQTTYNENQVTYMSDKLGLHRVCNPDPKNFAVSLHLYTPPSATIHGCDLYDEKTGKSSHIKMSNFYSVRGRRPHDLHDQ